MKPSIVVANETRARFPDHPPLPRESVRQRLRRLLAGLIAAVALLGGASVAMAPAAQAWPSWKDVSDAAWGAVPGAGIAKDVALPKATEAIKEGASAAACDMLPDYSGESSTGVLGMGIPADVVDKSGNSLAGDKAVWARNVAYWNENYTLYEVMGTSGLTTMFTKHGKQDGFAGPDGAVRNNCDSCAWGMNHITNVVLSGTQILTEGTIQFRRYATNPLPFVEFLDGMAAGVQELRGEVYAAGLLLPITLLGFWCITASTDPEKTRKVVPTIALSFAMAVGGGLLIWDRTDQIDNYVTGASEAQVAAARFPHGVEVNRPGYYWVTLRAVDWINQFNAAATDTLMGDGVASTDNTRDWCALPADAANRSRRAFDCRLYTEMSLLPWMYSQYGPMAERDPGFAEYAPPTGKFKSEWIPGVKKDTDGRYLDAEDRPVDIRLLQLHVQGQSLDNYRTSAAGAVDGVFIRGGGPDMGDPNTTHGALNHVRESMWQQHNWNYSMWQGGSAMSRFGAALLGGIMALFIAVFMFLANAGSAMWLAIAVLMFFALPFVALIAVAPQGQTLGLKYLSTWGRVGGSVFAYGLMQPVALVILESGLQLSVTPPIKAMAMLFFAVAMWKVLSAVRNGALAVNIGGHGYVATPADAAKSVTAAKDKARTAKDAAASATRKVHDTRVASAGRAAVAATGVAVVRRRGEMANFKKDKAARANAIDATARAAATREMTAKGVNLTTKEGKEKWKEQLAVEREKLQSEVAAPEKSDYVTDQNVGRAAVAAGTGQLFGRRGMTARSSVEAAQRALDQQQKAGPAGQSVRQRSEQLQQQLGDRQRNQAMAAAQREMAERQEAESNRIAYTREQVRFKSEAEDYEKWVAAGAPAKMNDMAVPTAWVKGKAPQPPLRPGAQPDYQRLPADRARQFSEVRKRLDDDFKRAVAAQPDLTRLEFDTMQQLNAAKQFDQMRAEWDAHRKKAEQAGAAVAKAERELQSARAPKDGTPVNPEMVRNREAAVAQKQQEHAAAKAVVRTATTQLNEARDKAQNVDMAVKAKLDHAKQLREQAQRKAREAQAAATAAAQQKPTQRVR